MTSQFETIAIRYEGGDAVNQLGLSLQGFARILAVCANFVETGRYNKQFDSLSVKVLAREPGEHQCYEVWATITSALSSGTLWTGVGAGATLLAPVIGYVLSRRDQQEMKLLKDALDKSLANQAETTGKLIATIEKMADALGPAARSALAPIGRSVSNIDLHEGATRFVSADETLKEHFAKPSASKFESTRKYSGLISEMDMKTGGCKVSFPDDETRIQAEITDPIRALPNNAYAMAFASQTPLAFMAKAEMDEDGAIAKLYISDLA
jgi:hypothetical protein